MPKTLFAALVAHLPKEFTVDTNNVFSNCLVDVDVQDTLTVSAAITAMSIGITLHLGKTHWWELYQATKRVRCACIAQANNFKDLSVSQVMVLEDLCSLDDNLLHYATLLFDASMDGSQIAELSPEFDVLQVRSKGLTENNLSFISSSDEPFNLFNVEGRSGLDLDYFYRYISLTNGVYACDETARPLNFEDEAVQNTIKVIFPEIVQHLSGQLMAFFKAGAKTIKDSPMATYQVLNLLECILYYEKAGILSTTANDHRVIFSDEANNIVLKNIPLGNGHAAIFKHLSAEFGV